MYKSNINFNKMYHLNISSEGCSISFFLEDMKQINPLIINLLKNTRDLSCINISKRDNRLCIFFQNVEESLEIIASLIIIDKYSIKLVKTGGENCDIS